MANKEADILTRLGMLELASEQHDENIQNLDSRLINHDKKWRQARPLLNEKANNKVERWIIIILTVVNILVLILS